MGGVLALLGVKADRMYDGLDKYNDLSLACTRLREHAIFEFSVSPSESRRFPTPHAHVTTRRLCPARVSFGSSAHAPRRSQDPSHKNRSTSNARPERGPLARGSKSVTTVHSHSSTCALSQCRWQIPHTERFELPQQHRSRHLLSFHQTLRSRKSKSPTTIPTIFILRIPVIFLTRGTKQS